MSQYRKVGHAALGLGGLGAATLVGALAEAQAFVVRHHQVPVLTPGSEPIRVLHLSDLHLLPGQHRKLRFVAGLIDERPDVVVSTGDNVASAEALPELLAAYGALLDLPGVFVFGSNDYWSPRLTNPLAYVFQGLQGGRQPAALPWQRTQQAFLARGWHDLSNHTALLDVAGRTIEFRGTDDAHIGKDDYQQVCGPPDPRADVAIGVTHAPYLRILDAMSDDGVPLVLAGHTHGGQVCLPVNRALVTNCDLEPARASGLHSHHSNNADAWLHVSAGLGSSPYAPYRLFCRPEACILTLVGADQPAVC